MAQAILLGGLGVKPQFKGILRREGWLAFNRSASNSPNITTKYSTQTELDWCLFMGIRLCSLSKENSSRALKLSCRRLLRYLSKGFSIKLSNAIANPRPPMV